MRFPARTEAFVAGVCAIHAENYVTTVQTTAELAACGRFLIRREKVEDMLNMTGG